MNLSYVYIYIYKRYVYVRIYARPGRLRVGPGRATGGPKVGHKWSPGGPPPWARGGRGEEVDWMGI